jgi:hypothetical protein
LSTMNWKPVTVSMSHQQLPARPPYIISIPEMRPGRCLRELLNLWNAPAGWWYLGGRTRRPVRCCLARPRTSAPPGPRPTCRTFASGLIHTAHTTARTHHRTRTHVSTTKCRKNASNNSSFFTSDQHREQDADAAHEGGHGQPDLERRREATLVSHQAVRDDQEQHHRKRHNFHTRHMARHTTQNTTRHTFVDEVKGGLRGGGEGG